MTDFPAFEVSNPVLVVKGGPTPKRKCLDECSTAELIDELAGRGGVCFSHVATGYGVTATAEGPACLLVVRDAAAR